MDILGYTHEGSLRSLRDSDDARYLGLTRRNAADLGAAREATAWLRRLNPEDPVAYDWALSRLGILAECVTERTRRHCERCAIRPVCRASLAPAKGAAAA